MRTVAGLAVFTVGLGLFVFPAVVANRMGAVLDRETGHRTEVAVRAAGLVAMVGGFRLLVA